MGNWHLFVLFGGLALAIIGSATGGYFWAARRWTGTKRASPADNAIACAIMGALVATTGVPIWVVLDPWFK